MCFEFDLISSNFWWGISKCNESLLWQTHLNYIWTTARAQIDKFNWVQVTAQKHLSAYFSEAFLEHNGSEVKRFCITCLSLFLFVLVQWTNPLVRHIGWRGYLFQEKVILHSLWHGENWLTMFDILRNMRKQEVLKLPNSHGK